GGRGVRGQAGGKIAGSTRAVKVERRIGPEAGYGLLCSRLVASGESQHHVVRLRILEMLAEERVEPVREAQELDRVERALDRTLLHLDATGGTLGGADVDVGVADPLEEPAAGAERAAEPAARQAIGPAHPRTAAIDELDVEVRNAAEELERRRAHIERAQVAWLMVPDPGAERLLGRGELAAPREAEQVLSEVHRVGRDEL